MERNLRQTDRRRGIIVTAIVHSLMLAANIVFGIKYLDPPPLSGVIVAYGTDADGAGSPAYNEQTPRETPAAVRPSEQKYEEVPEEALSTQDQPSPVEVKKVEKPKEKKTEKPKEKAPEKPVETTVTAPEPKKEQKPSDATARALANILDPGNDASKGDGQNAGYKGSPEGSLSSDKYGAGGVGGDGNYRLAGRKALTKPKPEYTGRDQGRVVVRVQVDRQGNVVSAKYSLQGTEVSDPVLIRNAERAAMQTKWQANPSAEPVQEGTIIYEFNLRG